MKIHTVKENDDGSCTMNCEFTEEEVNMLLEYAVNDILKTMIDLTIKNTSKKKED